VSIKPNASIPPVLETLTTARVAVAPVDEVLGWLGWSLGCLEQPAPCSAASLIAASEIGYR